jgi:hypothetical protein
MRTGVIEIEDKINDLVVCLDKDIEYIQNNLSNLDRLRTLVIKRDDTALNRLLENIQAESEHYKKHELHRQSIRKELAQYFDCTVGEITLSKLASSMTETEKIRIIQQKEKLRVLIKKLRIEYASTATLLTECARFNNVLLKSIFDIGNAEMVYYGANGMTKTRSESAFVNMKF